MADLRLSPEELRPLVREIVQSVLAEIDQARQHFDGKLVLSEPEAARLLGLNRWQLRDLRLAGKIGFTRIVGNRVRYTPDDLLDYLRRHRQPGKE